jgi:hypothetical protein
MTDRQTNSWDARDPGVRHDVHAPAASEMLLVVDRSGTRMGRADRSRPPDLGRTPAVDDVLTVEVDGRWSSGRR